MKNSLLIPSSLFVIVSLLLVETAIAQPNRNPADTNTAELGDLVKKHTRTITSTKGSPAPLSSQQLTFVLGQIILNPAERALLPESDLRKLEQISGRRDRRFVEAERAALSAICGKIQSLGRLDFSDVAQEFDRSCDGSEQQLVRYYEDAIKDLSAGTQRFIQSKLLETTSQVTFVQSTVNLFELTLESPQTAERMLTGGCKRYEESLQREPLLDITLLDEATKAQQFAPIVVEPK